MKTLRFCGSILACLILVLTASACGSKQSSADNLRHYAAGERVSLACGLSCTVPSAAKADFVLAPVPPIEATRPAGESLVPLVADPSSLPSCFNITSLSALQDFGLARSMTEHGVLAGSTPDGEVEVFYDSSTNGLCVLTHLPGKMLGCIVKWNSVRVHSRASALDEAAYYWRLFSIEGATLPDEVRR